MNQPSLFHFQKKGLLSEELNKMTGEKQESFLKSSAEALKRTGKEKDYYHKELQHAEYFGKTQKEAQQEMAAKDILNVSTEALKDKEVLFNLNQARWNELSKSANDQQRNVIKTTIKDALAKSIAQGFPSQTDRDQLLRIRFMKLSDQLKEIKKLAEESQLSDKERKAFVKLYNFDLSTKQNPAWQ